MGEKQKVMLYLPVCVINDLDAQILTNKKAKEKKEISRSAIITNLVINYLKLRGGFRYILKRGKNGNYKKDV